MRCWLFCVLIVFVSGPVRGQTEVRILSSRNFSHIELGSAFKIVCEVNRLAGKAVQWNHNGKLIATVAQGNTIVHMDPGDVGKYNFTGATREGGNFTMTINRFTATDVGYMKCTVENAQAIHYLRLFKPPDEVIVNFNSEVMFHEHEEGLLTVHVTEGSWLNITCISLRSVPRPNMQWLWNDTNSIMKWMATRKAFSMVNGVYNGTLSLYLPPGFTEMFRRASFPNLNESQSSVNPTGNDSVTAIKQDQPMITNREGLPIKLTCLSDVEGRRFRKIFFVRVGSHISRGDIFRPSVLFLLFAHIAFYAVSM